MVDEGGQVKAVVVFLIALCCCGLPDATAQSKAKIKEPLLIHVVVEYIEVEHLDYSDWLLENRLDHDANELRAAAQKWIESGRGKIIDTAVCEARSGQRGETQTGKSYAYSTEFLPPGVPKKVNLSGKEIAPITPGKVTDQETRQLGVLLEVDLVAGYDEITIHLSLDPAIVELKEKIGWPISKEHSVATVEFPIFHLMRITTQVTALTGRYTLLGTTRPLKASDPKRKSPLILQFVRADVVQAKERVIKQ